MKIVIASNSAWNLYNFRYSLIQRLVVEGHEVVALAPSDKYASSLESLGCRYVTFNFNAHNKNFLKDLLLVFNYIRVIRAEKPDAFFSFTIKPNIYGTLAAKALRVPVINTITGLGSSFISNNLLTRLVVFLYRLALFGSSKVFFQNDDDQSYFIENKITKKSISEIIPGSGINLNKFKFIPRVRSVDDGENCYFLMLSRIIWDKGIGEYVKAATIVRGIYPNAVFLLMGSFDRMSPSSIKPEELEEWVYGGGIKYLGVSDNVWDEIEKVDCIVLPSYREGLSRSLLEASAIGRPIITSNVPGCRDIVEDGENGFLCKPKDVEDLVNCLIKFLELNQEKRLLMGFKSRQKAELYFDEKLVLSKYLSVLDSIKS